MSARSRQRGKEHASYMKERGITRTTGMCPMGCGTPVKNGGEALLSHLTRCKGRRRAPYRVR